MGLPHFPDRNTDIDPDTLPQVSQMWPIIPPTQSLKKGMNLAVEEAVMVASAIGDASPLLGGKWGGGDISKEGGGGAKGGRRNISKEGRGGGRKRDSAVALSLGRRHRAQPCATLGIAQCAWSGSKLNGQESTVQLP